MTIVERALRQYIRRLQKLTRGARNGEVGRRILGILRLMDGYSVSEVAVMLDAARSSLYRWARRY